MGLGEGPEKAQEAHKAAHNDIIPIAPGMISFGAGRGPKEGLREGTKRLSTGTRRYHIRGFWYDIVGGPFRALLGCPCPPLLELWCGCLGPAFAVFGARGGPSLHCVVPAMGCEPCGASYVAKAMWCSLCGASFAVSSMWRKPYGRPPCPVGGERGCSGG